MTILLNFNLSASHEGEYTDTSIFASSQNANTGKAVREIISTAHKGGGKSLRMKLIGDGTPSTYRNEISGDSLSATGPTGVVREIPNGAELWFGFSVMCGKNNELLTQNDPELIWQCHFVQAPGGTVSPPLSLVVYGNKLYLDHRYNTTSDDNPVTVARALLGTIYPGVWSDIVLQLKFEHTSSGITKIWRDGRVVYNSVAPNNYNRASVKRYFKMGCYMPGWTSTPPSDGSARSVREWVFDAIKIGDSLSTYSDVAPPVREGTPIRPGF